METNEITACLCVDLIETWYHNRYYCTLHFDNSLIDLDIDSRPQKCKKANTSLQIIKQMLNQFEWNSGILLTLVGVINLIFI